MYFTENFIKISKIKTYKHRFDGVVLEIYILWITNFRDHRRF